MADEEIRLRVRRTRRFSTRPGSKPAKGSGSPSTKSYGPSADLGSAANAHGSWDAGASELENLADPLSDSDIDPMGDITPDFAKQGENESDGKLSGQEDDANQNSADGATKPKNNEDNDSGVANAEANTTAEDGSRTAATDKEQALQEEAQQEFENNVTGHNKQKGLVSRLKSRKAAMTVSIGAALVTVIVSVVTFLPGFILNHIGDIINGKINEFQNNQRLRYRRSKVARVKDVFSADGRRGGKIIAEMESRGYSFDFGDPTDKNKITGIKKFGSTVPLTGEDMGKEISDFMEKRHPFRLSGWKTKRMEAFYTRFGIKRSSPISPKANDPPDAENAVSKELAEGTYENTSKPDLDESGVARVPDDADEATKKAADDLADEAIQLADSDGVFEESKQAILKGQADTVDDTTRAVIDNIDNVTTDIVVQAAENAAKSGSFAKKAWSGVKSFFNPVDVPDRLCTGQSKLRSAQVGSRRVKKLALIKQMTQIKAAVDEFRRGRTTSKKFGALMRQIMGRDSNKRTFADSGGYGFAVNKRFSRSKNDIFRNRASTDGSYRGFWKKLSGFFFGAPGLNSSSCAVIQNPATSLGLAIGFTAVKVFSGGTAGVGTEALKKTLEQGVRGIVRSVLKTVLFEVSKELSFEGIFALMQLYAEKSLAFPVTTLSLGGALSDEVMSGAMAANEVAERRRGAVPATTQQYTPAYKQYLNDKKENLKHQSVFARYFDMQNMDSFVWQTSNTLAFGSVNYQNNPQNIVSNVASLPGNLFSTFTQTIIPKSSALDVENDEVAFESYMTEGDRPGLSLATDGYGNLLTYIPKSISDIDPQENIQFLIASGDIDPVTLEPISDRFKKHIENCVDAVDVISVIELNEAGDVTKDCLADQPGENGDLVRRFKAHLAYLDTLDALDSEFFPEELDGLTGGTGSGNGTTGVQIGDLTGPIIPCQGQPRELIREGDRVSWEGTTPTGSIGKNSAGQDINVYIRDACSGISAVRTVVIGSSIHGSENGGQYVAQDLLYNRDLPDDVRIIAIPEINKSGIPTGRRKNENNVNLNRNFDYKWNAASCSATGDGAGCKGPSPASEPETKAIQTFLSSVGESSLAISYHDNKNLVYYSAPNDNLSLPIGNKYYQIANSLGVGFDSVGRNDGEGFLESWYTDKTGTPALLIEMSSDSTTDYLKKHTDTVVKILEEQGLVR